MDLLSLNDEPLYFEAALEGGAAQLLEQAADCIGDPEGQNTIYSPRSSRRLRVLRYWWPCSDIIFTTSSFDAALSTSREADVWYRCNSNSQWRGQRFPPKCYSARGVTPRVRFYLFTLKGEGYVLLRQGQITEARKVLEWNKDRDKHDRIGASAMLNTLFS